MPKHLATFISVLCHPLLFPTYGVLFIILANERLFAIYPLKAQLLWLIIIFVFTFICPVVWLLMMRKLEIISDFKMLNPNDRIIPYIAVASFYMWMFKLFKPTTELTPYTNEVISLMMLGASFSIFIGFFINIFKKISIHAIGIGGFVGLVLCLMRLSDYDLRFFLIFVVLLAGLIGTARLISSDTKENELWAGYIAGFIGQFFSFTLIQMIFGS